MGFTPTSVAWYYDGKPYKQTESGPTLGTFRRKRQISNEDVTLMDKTVVDEEKKSTSLEQIDVNKRTSVSVNEVTHKTDLTTPMIIDINKNDMKLDYMTTAVNDKDTTTTVNANIVTERSTDQVTLATKRELESETHILNQDLAQGYGTTATEKQFESGKQSTNINIADGSGTTSPDKELEKVTHIQQQFIAHENSSTVTGRDLETVSQNLNQYITVGYDGKVMPTTEMKETGIMDKEITTKHPKYKDMRVKNLNGTLEWDLTLNSLEVSDSGGYVCVASSSDGRETTSEGYYLLVKDTEGICFLIFFII